MNPLIAEFIGTFILILLGVGVVANVILKGTKGYGSGWIVITTGWALAVFIAVAVAGPYSGAHINPAVSVGLAIAGLFDWAMVLPYCAMQILGGMAGAAVVWLMHKDHFDLSEDQRIKLGVFATAPAIRNYPVNIISEIVGTFILIFVILFFTPAVLEDQTSTPIGLGTLGALPVAFLVWGIGLSLGGTTGYAINPARDLGPRLAHWILPIKGKGGSDWSYSWVPVVGPLLGSALAAFTFLMLQI
ncbi:MIP/aquaporin family protein [Gillisia limnaea]|uniref:Major intrinsic protein n=1 Tax=Gillisia limnaea (strain DSM 15749 / LMG 21470 / R-8282) TaxID=865937 RepID=H2BT00_GILLR|nr:MIP/aquaporin family protein [Gillisia limnaea]EHQ01530.1 major intrinsic protein [Gillisia limnaea DSM 15749]